MITASGYSKDPNIVPEGIVITWSSDVVQAHGGLREFIRVFLDVMSREDGVWLQHNRHCPANDKQLLYVYIIFAGKVRYRCYYGGFEDCYLKMGGKVEIAPKGLDFKGFRGFRYCTKLF